MMSPRRVRMPLSESRDAKGKGETVSSRKKRGRRRVLASPRSGDERSETEVSAESKAVKQGLSSKSILGRRGLSIPAVPMAVRGSRRVRRLESKSPSSPGRLGESSEDEGSIMTLQTGENVLSGASGANEQSRGWLIFHKDKRI